MGAFKKRVKSALHVHVHTIQHRSFVQDFEYIRQSTSMKMRLLTKKMHFRDASDNNIG